MPPVKLKNIILPLFKEVNDTLSIQMIPSQGSESKIFYIIFPFHITYLVKLDPNNKAGA